jgi:hypothetical protein
VTPGQEGIRSFVQKNADTFHSGGEAARTRATLLAIAEGEAAKRKQALLAEAEGTTQLAAALAKMSTDAKLILVLDRLPVLFDMGGRRFPKSQHQCSQALRRR